MYFWKIEKLKEDVQTNKLMEKDRFIYALIYLVLGAIVMEALLLITLPFI